MGSMPAAAQVHGLIGLLRYAHIRCIARIASQPQTHSQQACEGMSLL